MDKFGVGNCFGMWSRNVMREVAVIENEKGMHFDLRLAMKMRLDMKTVPWKGNLLVVFKKTDIPLQMIVLHRNLVLDNLLHLMMWLLN
jgi:hypothetical protein